MTTEKFWEIVKILNWQGNYHECENTMKDLILKKVCNFQEFYNHFTVLEFIINSETRQRVAHNNPCFAPGINHGADDCHFTDLPGELIGRGPDAVADYLMGDLVPFEARQSFRYSFNNFL